MINDKYVRKDNRTNSSLHEFQTYYNDHTITKLNIFYYVYGLLHHPMIFVINTVKFVGTLYEKQMMIFLEFSVGRNFDIW